MGDYGEGDESLGWVVLEIPATKLAVATPLWQYKAYTGITYATPLQRNKFAQIAGPMPQEEAEALAALLIAARKEMK